MRMLILNDQYRKPRVKHVCLYKASQSQVFHGYLLRDPISLGGTVYPGTLDVNRAGHKLTEIFLLQSSECWD